MRTAGAPAGIRAREPPADPLLPDSRAGSAYIAGSQTGTRGVGGCGTLVAVTSATPARRSPRRAGAVAVVGPCSRTRARRRRANAAYGSSRWAVRRASVSACRAASSAGGSGSVSAAGSSSRPFSRSLPRRCRTAGRARSVPNSATSASSVVPARSSGTQPSATAYSSSEPRSTNCPRVPLK
ncbi:hypothetical protein [Streptomyces massasporeus]|uniref:hypothetical protein n=1 Tax=Streptomyces massasporeus TaxID=67324 RepID=UPI003F4D19C8